MNKILNHAIIGRGRIAQNHYNAAKSNNINIELCCDLDIDKAKNFAKKNNIPRYTSNYNEIINDDTIDCVSICTDHRSHVDIAKYFLNKKHIIIEKPLSSTFELANNFCKSATESNKIISVVSQRRFDNVINLIKKMVENEVFGKITLVDAHLYCLRDIKYYVDGYWRGKIHLEGGSTIINQSFHIVDTLAYLFGLPKNVRTFKRNFNFEGIINTEDTCVSIIDYGCFLCSLSSTNTSIQDWSTSITIIGTKGTVKFNIDFPEEIIQLEISDDLKKIYENELSLIKENYLNNLKGPANYYGLSHNAQFEDFKNSILENKSPKVSIKEAIQTQKFIDMIYRG